MSLILTVVDPDTFEIALAAEDTLESPGRLLIHSGEYHEGIPYEVWATFVGTRVRLDLVEAAAALERADVAIGAATDAATDIPADVRDFTRCPGCGVILIAATLQIPSASLSSRLLSGATFEDAQALRLDADGKARNLMWTGQQLPARWCPECRLVLFRV